MLPTPPAGPEWCPRAISAACRSIECGGDGCLPAGGVAVVDGRAAGQARGSDRDKRIGRPFAKAAITMGNDNHGKPGGHIPSLTGLSESALSPPESDQEGRMTWPTCGRWDGEGLGEWRSKQASVPAQGPRLERKSSSFHQLMGEVMNCLRRMERRERNRKATSRSASSRSRHPSQPSSPRTLCVFSRIPDITSVLCDYQSSNTGECGPACLEVTKNGGRVLPVVEILVQFVGAEHVTLPDRPIASTVSRGFPPPTGLLWRSCDHVE